MKINKDITVKRAGGMEYVVPKGSLVEKNTNSSTGFYVCPAAFKKGTIERHDAVHYGFSVKTEDINFEMAKKEKRKMAKIINESHMIENINALIEECDKDDLINLYKYLFPSQRITEDNVCWDLTDGEN